MQVLENLIFKELCSNPEYRQKVLPYLKDDYFQSVEARHVLAVIDSYVQKYKNNVIDFDIVEVEMSGRKMSDQEFKRVQEYIRTIRKNNENIDSAWLIDQTEKFCQENAVAAALAKSVELYDQAKKSGNAGLGAIPDLLADALKVSFKVEIGHDYFSDAELAFDNYTNYETNHIPFNLFYFDKITSGGILRKTLNIVMAGTGGGKTIFMCGQAANYLMQGLNVLYLTGEMSQYKIRERIDANLMDIEVNALRHMSKTVFLAKQKKLQLKTKGRLIIKEFEEGGATNALHFSHWVEELRIKENFVPDVVVIDYLSLMGSYRVKMAQGMYTVGKSVSEEVRAFAKRHNVAVLTGAQFNRGGMDNSDPGITNTSESVGIPFTADLIFALINTHELAKLKQQCVKQLKNRYNDVDFYNKFIVGLDKPKMRHFDVEESAQAAAEGVEDYDDSSNGNDKIRRAANRPPSSMFQ